MVYYNTVAKPEQIKCTFTNDPDTALFIRFDPWTAQCIKHQKIRKSQALVLHFQYGARNNEPLRSGQDWISTWGFDVKLNNSWDKATKEKLVVTQKDRHYVYKFSGEKKAGNLGWHLIEVTIDQTSTTGIVKTIAKDHEGVEYFDQDFELQCTTKYWTTMNGEQVGFRETGPLAHLYGGTGC